MFLLSLMSSYSARKTNIDATTDAFHQNLKDDPIAGRSTPSLDQQIPSQLHLETQTTQSSSGLTLQSTQLHVVSHRESTKEINSDPYMSTGNKTPDCVEDVVIERISFIEQERIFKQITSWMQLKHQAFYEQVNIHLSPIYCALVHTHCVLHKQLNRFISARI